MAQGRLIGLERVIAIVLAVSTVAAMAQTTEDQTGTLADIRQELSVLYVGIQRLKRELSTTGGPGTDILAGNSVLDRLNAIESGLQRLTAQTEQLDFRIKQIVADGTNRIGDLEFRLVELEGGDISQLGTTTTLGEAVTATPLVPVVPSVPTAELAVGEQADFDAATAALDTGDYTAADRLFANFVTAYPGSPMMPQAEFSRGAALEPGQRLQLSSARGRCHAGAGIGLCLGHGDCGTGQRQGLGSGIGRGLS